MLNFLPSIVLGVIVSFLLFINILFWVTVLFIFAIPKILLPWPPLLKIINRILHWIGENWISGNSGWMWLTQKNTMGRARLGRFELSRLVSGCK